MIKKFKTKGMHCESCKILVTEGLSEIKGVKKVDASWQHNIVTVDFDDKCVKEVEIVKAIENEGYKVLK